MQSDYFQFKEAYECHGVYAHSDDRLWCIYACIVCINWFQAGFLRVNFLIQ